MSKHTTELLELVEAVRAGNRLHDAADTLLHFQSELFRSSAALEALKGLQSAIDRKMAYLNPGRQTENWLSPVLEEAIAKAREVIAQAQSAP